MKMKHVMAALLFGVVALSTAQAEEEKHYRYYPYSMEAFYTGILASKDLNKGCEIGLNNFNKYVLNPENKEGADAKYKKPWTDYTRNDHPHRQIMCSYKQHSYLGNGKWSPWVDAEYVLTGITCYDGGRFLWRDKNLCAEEVDKKDVVVCDPSFHEDGKVPEGCPPLPPPKNPCDPSNYPNGIVPEDCPKTELDPNDPRLPKCPLQNPGYPIIPPMAMGAVACNDFGSTVCVWDYKLENLGNDEANRYHKECYEAHENYHKNETDFVCTDGFRAQPDKKKLLKSESLAYNAQFLCLLKARDEKCSNQTCKDALTDAIQGSLKRSADNAAEYYKK